MKQVIQAPAITAIITANDKISIYAPLYNADSFAVALLRFRLLLKAKAVLRTNNDRLVVEHHLISYVMCNSKSHHHIVVSALRRFYTPLFVADDSQQLLKRCLVAYRVTMLSHDFYEP